MVADHWFRQVEKILEAVEITSDAKKIRLAAFQLEGESQVWWDWIKTSRDLEAIDLAREFLELKQETMTVMEYVAKFIELACLADDYVATYMAKVMKFEDGLKLSIQGKIVRFLLQDMDFIVRTAMAIKREIEDAQNIQDMGACNRGRRVSLLLVRERS